MTPFAAVLQNSASSHSIFFVRNVKWRPFHAKILIYGIIKDKLIKGEGASSEVLFQTASSEAVEEASSALQMLGFTKPNIQKAIQNILKANPNASVEQIIKSALHML